MHLARDHELGRRHPEAGDLLEDRQTGKRASVLGMVGYGSAERGTRLFYLRLMWVESGRRTERLLTSVPRGLTLVFKE